MHRVKYWALQGATKETITLFDKPMCQGDDGINWPCSYFPHFTLSWTVNTTGLPLMGTRLYDFACRRHLAQRVSRIPFEDALSVTLTPYEMEKVDEDKGEEE
jgi:hypothetical protein